MNKFYKPELSKKNPYYISRHRYYELKHFCLQYQDWYHEYSSMAFVKSVDYTEHYIFEKNKSSNPTEKLAMKRIELLDRMSLVRDSAYETDQIIGPHVLRGVTTGLSYDTLNANQIVPCSKDEYYRTYRKFFWILDKKRG